MWAFYEKDGSEFVKGKHGAFRLSRREFGTTVILASFLNCRSWGGVLAELNRDCNSSGGRRKPAAKGPVRRAVLISAWAPASPVSSGQKVLWSWISTL